MGREESKKSIGREIAYIALFCALTVVCSWVVIPTPIPFTLATFALFLGVCVLGAKRALLVTSAYLALGFVGVPVFSGFVGGVGALFGATGGYLIGYFVGGVLMCGLEYIPLKKGGKILTLTGGLLVYYACGVLWYALVFVQGGIGVWAALLTCVLPFVIPDVAKLVLAIFLEKKIKPFVFARRR